MRRVWLRYLLFQIPGLALLTLVMWAFHQWFGVSPWIGAAIVAAWMAKDLLLYPLLKDTYRLPETTSERRLVGAHGTAADRLDPSAGSESCGWVRIGRELWRCRLAPGAGPIEKGERVRVIDAEGMTVVVESEGKRS